MNKLRFIILLPLVSIFSLLSGQVSPFEDNVGYIVITSDTSNIPIFIDGTLIGHTPLEKPIPVLPGNHKVGIHPISVTYPFAQYGPDKTKKNIYVIQGDTNRVHLNSFLLHQQLIHQKKESLYSKFINITLSMLLIWQMLILSG
ncbi:MAG: hypothetical protein Ct9H90mP20_4280 [Candidatus Neomarinimicrobiota bacterium]|nr:MAG: hypothetical protein Ct9H90mP20_4280 [Candidatus Neomarinimicrobiota bacterium]